MKRRLFAIMLAFVMAMSLVIMTGCGKEEGGTVESEMLENEMQSGDTDFENPVYEVEEDGATPESVAHDEKDFIGSWKATSNQAAYLWGNVDLTINEDGTWKGNITEEDFHGKWVSDGTGIVIKDSEGMINWKLYFTPEKVLVFEEDEEPGDAIVLEPAKGAFKN